MTIPVVQAPMAGGPSTPELVAAVCNAGGLGSLGAEYLTPGQIEQAIEKIRGLTSRPFAVNLFSPDADQAPAGELAAVAEFLSYYHERLGIGVPEFPASWNEDFNEQIEVLYRSRVPIVSFTLGTLPIKVMDRLKGQSTYVIGTATTVKEAIALERAGVDAITAQGSDAGGHRGTFLAEAESVLVGTMALVPQIVDAVSLPVLASGGIMDGRGVVAALALGASAAQMGTAFLLTDEAGTNQAARKALLDAQEDQTAITRAFSGRPARGLRNEFIEDWNKSGLKPMSFPLQNALTRPMRRAAAARGEAGVQSVWAGQGLRLLRKGPAASIMLQLQKEIADTAAILDKVFENTRVPVKGTLQMDMDEKPEEITIHCNGRITAESAHMFQREIQDNCIPVSRGKGVPVINRVILDLSNVTHIDNVGLEALLDVWTAGQRKSCSVEIINQGLQGLKRGSLLRLDRAFRRMLALFK